MCAYCWMGRELRWEEARMAQGLASPVMAYLSLCLSISSAPEHSSGLRAVGRGGWRGWPWISLPQCPWWRPVSSDKQQSGVNERVEGSCFDGSTVHTGYHQWTSKHTQIFAHLHVPCSFDMFLDVDVILNIVLKGTPAIYSFHIAWVLTSVRQSEKGIDTFEVRGWNMLIP